MSYCLFRAKVIPENILKKQQRDQKLLAKRKADKVTAKKDRKTARDAAFKSAEKYAAEYAKADQDLVDSKRKAKKEGNFYVPAEPKVAFLVRIKG